MVRLFVCVAAIMQWTTHTHTHNIYTGIYLYMYTIYVCICWIRRILLWQTACCQGPDFHIRRATNGVNRQNYFFNFFFDILNIKNKNKNFFSILFCNSFTSPFAHKCVASYSTAKINKLATPNHICIMPACTHTPPAWRKAMTQTWHNRPSLHNTIRRRLYKSIYAHSNRIVAIQFIDFN